MAKRFRRALPRGSLLAALLALSASGCAIHQQRVTMVVRTLTPASDPAFGTLMGDVLRVPLLDGNRIVTLINGDQFFPAMLDAIRAAEQSITFENWSWQSGPISDQFVAALTERAQAGVKVHVILDALGGMPLRKRDEERMQRAGVQWVRYNRVWKLWQFHHRTHRKLLIIDGKLGFTGGMCLGDAWTGNADSPEHWRDNQYQLEGPVVRQMQEIFLDNWSERTGTSLTGNAYFPSLPPRGNSRVHAYLTGPGDALQRARLAYLFSIAGARKNIRIAHSYFLPDDVVIRALIQARQRGVRIEIITPGIIDWNVVKRASRSRWMKLMEAGVEFYEYQPALLHCKIMIVDDAWTIFGSVNFDDRSFYLNDEANVGVWDPALAAEQIAIFQTDQSASQRIDLEQFRRRSLWMRCLEAFAGLFRSQM